MRRSIIAMSLTALAATSASAMPVADFLGKAQTLKAKGMMALFSSDLGLLKGETTAGFKAWRAQVAPPGRKPNACPPPGPQRTNSDEILAMLEAVPPADRTKTSVASALTAGLNRRFPCR